MSDCGTLPVDSLRLGTLTMCICSGFHKGGEETFFFMSSGGIIYSTESLLSNFSLLSFFLIYTFTPRFFVSLLTGSSPSVFVCVSLFDPDEAMSLLSKLPNCS